jgi:triosephosphate isomerase
MEDVLRAQIETCLKDLPKEEVDKVILAYEPVWAIGTGKSATAKMAQEAHAFCKTVLSDLFGKRKAGTIPILYGGSVTEKNIADLTLQKDIDGVLVGGSSLDPKTLSQITRNCKKNPKKVKEE